jgi:hypothetical protein
MTGPLTWNPGAEALNAGFSAVNLEAATGSSGSIGAGPIIDQKE